MYQGALKLVQPEARNHKEFVATIYHNLGGLEHARGRYARGLPYACRAVEIRKTVQPRDRLALAADEAALAAILVELGRIAEARRIYFRALRVFRHRLAPRHYEVGAVWANLGALYSRAAQLALAERALRRGVCIMEETMGKNHPRIASAINNLAVVCAHRGKLREATALYRRVLRLLEHRIPSTYPRAALVRENCERLRRINSKAPLRPDSSGKRRIACHSLSYSE